MKLYLDDDSIHGVLIRFLTRGGHDVRTPTDTGLSGADDPVHLTRAILDRYVLLSRNHDDFRKLHELVITRGGSHPGILMVRQDNDPNRDMTPRAIVTALAKLESANFPLENQFVILNQWR